MLVEFVTFEDLTALYDGTLFPDLFRRVCSILATNEVYVLERLVEKEFGVVTLTVRALELLPASGRQS
jgi:error-prone DNA polymerase